jgi:hypothetical protein
MLESLKLRIAEWRRLGRLTDVAGSEIVAHTPRDHPEAYLHAIFAAKKPREWACYFPNLPEPLEALFWECNGLTIFSELSLWGIRDHYVRNLSARFQPFDLLAHHEEKVCELHPSERCVFFGSFFSSGVAVAISYESSRVFGYHPIEKEPIAAWSDIASFLAAEFDRLESLHDESGYPIRPLTSGKNA